MNFESSGRTVRHFKFELSNPLRNSVAYNMHNVCIIAHRTLRFSPDLFIFLFFFSFSVCHLYFYLVSHHLCSFFFNLIISYLFDSVQRIWDLSTAWSTSSKTASLVLHFRVEAPPSSRPDSTPARSCAVRVWVLFRIAWGRSISRYAPAPHCAAPASSS